MGTFIGSSLRLNGPAQNNSNQVVGECAGSSLNYGGQNNFFGNNAGRYHDGGYNNFLGTCAGRSQIAFGFGGSGTHNNFFGTCAGRCIDCGSFNNFFGLQAGENNTTGYLNNFIGFFAGRCNQTGRENNFIGCGAGRNNITGYFNDFVGFDAGCDSQFGYRNAFFGPSSGRSATQTRQNSFFGYSSGSSVTTGSNNLLIGSLAGVDFGFYGYCGLVTLTTQSNRIVMGNGSHTCAQIQIGWTTVSDTRDKCIYGSIERGLGFLRGITPIEYQFKDRENDEIIDPIKKRRYGFSAQEILELEGDQPVIVSDENPDKLQITTDHLLPVMVNAIKELAAKCEALEERIAILEQ